MNDTLVEAPKMFREMDGVSLSKVRIPDAQETLWHCRNIICRDCEVENADYLFMHCTGIRIDGWRQKGNYSFQYCRDVEIRNARIESKDAFWNTENVTVCDSGFTANISDGIRAICDWCVVIYRARSRYAMPTISCSNTARLTPTAISLSRRAR